jgi:hypothetical protein
VKALCERGIATELNGREIPTLKDGMWPVVQVQRVLDAV